MELKCDISMYVIFWFFCRWRRSLGQKIQEKEKQKEWQKIQKEWGCCQKRKSWPISRKICSLIRQRSRQKTKSWRQETFTRFVIIYFVKKFFFFFLSDVLKDGLISERFFTLSILQKMCQITTLGGKVQVSDLAHFFEDERTFWE